VYQALLRRLVGSGLRKGMSGSTPWMILGLVAGGLRIIGRIARDDDAVVYRTAIKAGDVFEIITRPKQ
jgi:hypothetical protein